MVWPLGQTGLCEDELPLVNLPGSHHQPAHPWLVLHNEGPGLVMIYRVVELTMLGTTITNLTVELTAANTWPLTDPARGNLTLTT